MTKTRLALTIAMMFAVPAGVVALEQSASTTEMEVSTPAPELAATAGEPVTEAAPAEAMAEQAPTVVPQEPAQRIEDVVRPAPNVRRIAASDTFPADAEPGGIPLPRQLAYLDRMEAQRAHLIARGDAFPTSNSPDEALPLPRQLAYLDRVEQARLAAAQPREVVAQAPAVPAADAPISVAEVSPR